jgi:predicted AAA+ superfamily ATPase
VGKTTLSKQLGGSYVYLNFDSAKDRAVILAQEWDRDVDRVIFDELHKMKQWKSWVKGVYDTDGARPRIMVTGSARMDVFRKGGDSLAGRYFSHRLHPLTVKEVVSDRALGLSSDEALTRILSVGGFPEPFFNADRTYAARWRKTHLDRVIREDLLDLERVRDIKSIEIMVEMLRERVGAAVSYSSLANELQVSVPTVKHWLSILEDLYVVFPVRPYTKNIARSILKETKYYFYDTGAVKDEDGARLENAVACALWAELQYHEDLCGAQTALCYVRDKERREVDFVTVVDKKPRHLIEVKIGDDTFSKNLIAFAPRFDGAACVQLVRDLRQRKSHGAVRMMTAHEFLATFDFDTSVKAKG